jgi:nicotinamidase-related amidase
MRCNNSSMRSISSTKDGFLIIKTGLTKTLWPRHAVENEAGSEFQKDLLVKETDIIIRKGVIQDTDSYSG